MEYAEENFFAVSSSASAHSRRNKLRERARYTNSAKVSPFLMARACSRTTCRPSNNLAIDDPNSKLSTDVAGWRFFSIERSNRRTRATCLPLTRDRANLFPLVMRIHTSSLTTRQRSQGHHFSRRADTVWGRWASLLVEALTQQSPGVRARGTQDPIRPRDKRCRISDFVFFYSGAPLLAIVIHQRALEPSWE